MNNKKQKGLMKCWALAASDLKLEIISPFELKINENISLEAEFLLKNFGAKNGMIVFSNYDSIEPYHDQIVKLGYGYSVIRGSSGSEEYDREVILSVLSDWGWSGEDEKKPEWLEEN